MTKKTGSKTLKARQLMKAARMWRQIQRMREEGIKLEAPRPTKEEAKQKEEELEKLYLELTGGQSAQPAEETPSEESGDGEESTETSEELEGEEAEAEGSQ